MPDQPYKVVLDTNVIIAAARSRRGASAAILALVGTERIRVNLSVALALEYEEVLKRDEQQHAITPEEVNELVSFLCANATRWDTVARPWPLASERDDEMVARLATTCACDYLVTHNVRHFEPLRGLGVPVVSPREFLRIIRSGS